MTQVAIMRRLLKYIQKRTPFDTGNLCYSTKIKRIKPNIWELYVDSGDNPYLKDYTYGMAPYVPFVNEKWVSTKWHGRQNPNENYWNKSVEQAISMLAKILEGELERGTNSRKNS